MQNNKKDQMHPEDMRNLIIFALCSIAIWFLYETYILGPQTKALKESKLAKAEMILRDPKLLDPVINITREEAISQGPRITFKNDEVFGTISLKGGQIDDLNLTKYFETLEKKKNVSILKPPGTKETRFMDYGWVTRDKNLNLPNANTQWQVKDNDILQPDLPVTLYWDNGQNIRFERIIELDEAYVFTITQKIINNSGKDITLHPYALISQKDIPSDYTGTWVSYEGPMGFIGGKLEQISYAGMTKNPNEKFEAQRGWIGISDKYWLTAIIPQQNETTKFRFKHTPDPLATERRKYQTDFTGAEMEIASGAQDQYTTRIYAGAKKVLTLEAYQKDMGIDNLDLAVDFGWFWFFTYPFFLALHYLALMVGNVGVAIIILTCIIRTAVFPLTNISFRSFAKMKVVAPQITAIRDKYNDDKQKMQQEIVELYQREGVNPMSGCLPMLLQIPIFFAFYKILFITIEVRHAPFFGWIDDLSAKDPTSIFNLFGLLPYQVPDILVIGAWPCMMLLAMLMQKKLNPPPQDKLQRDMMNIFPFFITFIMASFASGLVIYWTFSAVLSIIQQSIIMRSLGVPVYFFNVKKYKELEAQEKEMLKKGGDAYPLIDMAEQEAEKALFGDDGNDGDAPIENITPPKHKKKKKKK